MDGVGEATRFAQIVALMESASATKPQGAMLADRLAKPFLIGVLLAAAGACAWWWGRDPGHALIVAVAVLIVTCPCALSLATPAAMLAAAGAMARGGVMVRRLQALEVLAEVDTLVFDKTGTLTRDAMVLGGVQARSGCTAHEALELAAVLAGHSLHPVSRTLAAAHLDTGESPTWVCSAVTEHAGQGVEGVATSLRTGDVGEGRALRLGSAIFCNVEHVSTADALVHLSDGDGWLATFELKEDIREKAAETVQLLQGLGVAVNILSGDRSESVARIAALAGITRARGGCTPDDKLAFIREMQAQGRQVAMVGDGLNDGPQML